MPRPPTNPRSVRGTLSGSESLLDDVSVMRAAIVELQEAFSLDPLPGAGGDTPAPAGTLARTLTIANEVGAGWGLEINKPAAWEYAVEAGSDDVSLGNSAAEFAAVVVTLDGVLLAHELGYDIVNGVGVNFISDIRLGNNIALPVGSVLRIESPYAAA